MKQSKRLYQRWKVRSHDTEIVGKSGLFDAAFYLRNNPDVANAGVDPLQHYIRRGRYEGRSPREDFDASFYLKANSDVEQAGMDPFIHYVLHGREEKRLAHPHHQTAEYLLGQSLLRRVLFDPHYYRTAYPDVALSGADPLDHYLTQGRRENRKPSADFDPVYYLAKNPDLRKANKDPLLHFIEIGHSERRCHCSGFSKAQLSRVLAQIRDSGLFDAEFYLSQCPAVRDSGVDPLFHYAVSDQSLFLDPSPGFSAANYLEAHREIRFETLNPLVHYLSEGAQQFPSACRPPRSPDDLLTFERKAGRAYFERYLFPFDTVSAPNEYVAAAVSDLARYKPRLTIDYAAPDVSIIIPVFGQIHFVLGCLHSLSRQESRFSVEIIVADDASPEAAQAKRLNEIPWIRYHRFDDNCGFVDNCNRAATLAQGRYLVFLNTDTRVAEEWLDELINSFSLFPKAGLVGSSLSNADGTLQEAGGIYWRDGSAWNYGRNDDPNHPKYCFARRVDYVSGASIAIPAELWRVMGGFNTMYRPAYCEDADLAFRLREAGYEVWLQPLSRVIHYEGKTHGCYEESGIKQYQRRNMQRFAERWRCTLSEHRENGRDPDEEANRCAGERVLVLDAVTPTPDKDSGSFITIRMLKALQVLGYQITFVPQHSYQYDPQYTKDLQRNGIECLYEPHFANIGDVLNCRSNFDVVLAYRFKVLIDVYDELRRRMPCSRLILHNVDLHFLREEREAALYRSRSKKVSAALTRSCELELIAKVDCTIVHTNAEAAIIGQHVPLTNVVEFPYIADTHRSETPFEERCDIMFLGGFGHPPNVDAVKYFVRDVWPAIATSLPACARLLIVGSSVTEEVQLLAGPRIVITGYVEDLQPYFDAARVFVAPIRYGAGIKGKVIQSLSYGTPAVITSIAAEGIGVVSGRDAIVVDGEASFAEQVLRLYSDPILWYSLQEAGYAFVEENFSWKRSLRLMTEVLDTADRVWLGRQERALKSRLRDVVAECQSAPAVGETANTWVAPGHFYSPLVDPHDPVVAKTLSRYDELELPEECGIKLDRDAMLAFFIRLSERYRQLPFVANKTPHLHYYYENPLFSYGDAIMLGLMTLEFRPKRIVEVGSGFSSAAMIDLNEQLFGGKIDLTFVEPYPEVLTGILPEGSHYRKRICRQPVQSVPGRMFQQLEPDDILFVDSTHVAKMGSDVNHLLFNVFPLLRPGVLIHVHDIFYPFEYPPAWILEENRSWNEAYLLRAFLEFNESFEVMFYSHFACRKFPDVLEARAPLFAKNGGGSLWMRRTQ